MRRLICHEFLKAVPRRTLLWAAAIWIAFLVWGLVVLMGNSYLSAVETLRVISDSPLAPDELRQRSEDRVRGFSVLLSPQFAPSHGLAIFSGLLGMLIPVILVSKLFGDEYGLGTIRRLWTQGPPRALRLAGKLGAVCLVILAAMALTCVVAVLLTAVVRWFYPIPVASAAEFPLPGQRIGQLAVQWIVSLAICLLVTILAGLVASVARNALAGFVFVLVLMNVEPGLPLPIRRILPIWHMQVLRALAFPEFVFQVEVGGPVLPGLVGGLLPAPPEASLAVSLGVLAVHGVLLAGLLHVVWKRQEAP